MKGLLKRLLLPALLALLQSCGNLGEPGTDSPCRGRRRDCAAAAAPAGLRSVRKGHRIVAAQWEQRRNKESGLPDIGIRARWQAFTERR